MQYIEEKIKFVDGRTSVKRYEIISRIGEGSFSSCYKVRVANSDSLFAMKIISKNKLEVLKKVKLIEQIKIHQSLLHPNIVFLDHWFQDEQNQYIFLQLCSSQTLEDKCPKFTVVDQREIARYGLDIVKALKYLHSMKVVHRDLKLSNFFIGFDGSIKLGDFGFACKIQDGQMKRDSCGTPNFTAPQVINMEGYRFLPDIWSFGCVLYRMKYGVCPFQSEELQQILRKIRHCQWKFKDWTTISPQFQDLLKKMLVANPAQRITLDQMEKHPFFNQKLSISRSFKNFMSNLFGKKDQTVVNSVEGQTSNKSIEGKNNIKAILKDKVETQTSVKPRQVDEMLQSLKTPRTNRQRSLNSKKTDILNFLKDKSPETKTRKSQLTTLTSRTVGPELMNKKTLVKQANVGVPIKTPRQFNPSKTLNSARLDTQVTVTTDNNTMQMPSNPLMKLKTMFKTEDRTKKTTVLEIYPFFVVSKMLMSNQYLLIELTNGINQIFKAKEMYIFSEKGKFYDEDGRLLKNPPKTIEYMSNEKMTFRPTKTSCETIIKNNQYIRQWKQFQGRIIVQLTKAIAMTTSLPNIYYLNIFGQRDVLYNSSMEVCDDSPNEMLKCRQIYRRYSGDSEKRRERSVSRGKKLLE